MTDTLPTSTAFEVRFDALVSRMQRLAKVAGGGTVGAELLDVAAEMARVRRDLGNYVVRVNEAIAVTERNADEVVTAAGAAVEEARVPVEAATPEVEPDRRPYRSRGTGGYVRSSNPQGRNGQARKGTQKVRGQFVKLPRGKRWCAGHDGGEGAMLDESEFKVKNPATGQFTSWCTSCTRRYQQDRYVRVGYKRVTVEVAEGDSIVGHDCRLCGFPFEIGERVQGVDVAHEKCLDGTA